MPSSRVRHLAVSHAGHRIAAGEFEHTVSVWDVQTGERISEFETVLDFGGQRLAVDPSGSFVAAAAYDRHRLACYSAGGGTLLWHRKDLKQLQFLAFSADGQRLACCSDIRPCVVLDLTTGETVATLRGVRAVHESHFEPIRLLDRTRPELQTLAEQRIAYIARETFAFLDVAFGPNLVCISESGGSVRWLSTSTGDELWRYDPKPGRHVLRLSYVPSTGCFAGVEWPYEKGGTSTLLAFDATSGQAEVIALLDQPPTMEFCLEGECLMTSEGQLLRVSDGMLIRELPFDSLTMTASVQRGDEGDGKPGMLCVASPYVRGLSAPYPER